MAVHQNMTIRTVNKVSVADPGCLSRIFIFIYKVRTYKEYHSVCPSSELGLPPTPHPQASVPPPPCFWGEGNTRWRERGWESPNSDEGHTVCYSLYVRTLCFYPSRIPGPTTAPKDEGEIFFCPTILCRNKYHNFVNHFIFEQVKKFFKAKTVRITVPFNKKFVPKL
jgi:hypothetical protein